MFLGRHIDVARLNGHITNFVNVILTAKIKWWTMCASDAITTYGFSAAILNFDMTRPKINVGDCFNVLADHENVILAAKIKCLPCVHLTL